MSNLSDIGFPVRNDEDVNVLITETINRVEAIKCPQGFYLRFADSSGAEIFLQGNEKQELVGFNPHFDGKSRRIVRLTRAIERDSSELDGGFCALANPGEENDSGDYAFVFDVPDFRMVGEIDFPANCEIQLTAFASNDFKIYESEQDYYDAQTIEPKLAAKSFVASGLFAASENDDAPPRPIGIFSGEIKEFELKTNELSKEKFYSFLVETPGGEVDVVADVKLVANEPKIGGVVSGQFWLSGRIIDSPEFAEITNSLN
ncbi:MAG: hypothetical protein M3525_08430 [Acidobacteriota bacterium]|nr:hypothetical protein [Acidobacteriota bacterium]